jgi:hypothetical protein
MGRGSLAGDGVAGRVLIPRRFNGPPASANGGYTSGLIARYVGGPADVSLRSPPPLDTALELERTDDGELRLWHRDVLVAEGSAADPPDIEPPVRPTVAQAREAQRRHPWLEQGGRHPFNACYVCGASRHDGLGMHFGDLRAHPDMTAALLIADETVPHDPRGLAPEIAWAALDCPSYVPALWHADTPSLLARMQAEVLEPIPLGVPIVAVGWLQRAEGNKHWTASALLDADGRLLARAGHLWIRPRAAAS